MDMARSGEVPCGYPEGSSWEPWGSNEDGEKKEEMRFSDSIEVLLYIE